MSQKNQLKVEVNLKLDLNIIADPRNDKFEVSKTKNERKKNITFT